MMRKVSNNNLNLMFQCLVYSFSHYYYIRAEIHTYTPTFLETGVGYDCTCLVSQFKGILEMNC